jgi:hypothetical protein
MHSYLVQVFEKIVVPMEFQVKNVMMQFLLANESELYASNLNFKLCDDSSNNRYKSDPSLKHEYTLQNLN